MFGKIKQNYQNFKQKRQLKKEKNKVQEDVEEKNKKAQSLCFFLFANDFYENMFAVVCRQTRNKKFVPKFQSQACHWLWPPPPLAP